MTNSYSVAAWCLFLRSDFRLREIEHALITAHDVDCLRYHGDGEPEEAKGGLAQRWADRPVAAIDGHDIWSVILPTTHDLELQVVRLNFPTSLNWRSSLDKNLAAVRNDFSAFVGMASEAASTHSWNPGAPRPFAAGFCWSHQQQPRLTAYRLAPNRICERIYPLKAFVTLHRDCLPQS